MKCWDEQQIHICEEKIRKTLPFFSFTHKFCVPLFEGSSRIPHVKYKNAFSWVGLFALLSFVLERSRVACDNFIFTHEPQMSTNRKLFDFFWTERKAQYESGEQASSCITAHAFSNPISCQMPKEVLYMGDKGSDGITAL